MEYNEWIRMVPYGKWTCADGREVLFNRGYRPILERYPGQAAHAARPGEWVKFKEQMWFFDDYTSPIRRSNARTIARLNAVLADWGLPPLPPRPRKPRCTPAAPLFVKAYEFTAGLKPYHNPWSDVLTEAA